jgi:hypothetical protein
LVKAGIDGLPGFDAIVEEFPAAIDFAKARFMDGAGGP